MSNRQAKKGIKKYSRGEFHAWTSTASCAPTQLSTDIIPKQSKPMQVWYIFKWHCEIARFQGLTGYSISEPGTTRHSEVFVFSHPKFSSFSDHDAITYSSDLSCSVLQERTCARYNLAIHPIANSAKEDAVSMCREYGMQVLREKWANKLESKECFQVRTHHYRSICTNHVVETLQKVLNATSVEPKKWEIVIEKKLLNGVKLSYTSKSILE